MKMKLFLCAYEKSVFDDRGNYLDVVAKSKDDAIMIALNNPQVFRVIGCEEYSKL